MTDAMEAPTEIALARENADLRARLAHAEKDLALAREQLSAADGDVQSAADRVLRLQRKNTLLAQVRAATAQLLHAGSPDEVLEGVLEIVANLIGCEDAAIFEAVGGELLPAKATGREALRAQKVRIGVGAIGGSVARASAVYGTDGLVAAVPLLAAGRVLGVLVLFRLLPQKAGLEPTDRELLETVGGLCALAWWAARTGDARA